MQMDHNGTYIYSPVKAAILDEWENSSITIAPNPAVKVLEVLLKRISKKKCCFENYRCERHGSPDAEWLSCLR